MQVPTADGPNTYVIFGDNVGQASRWICSKGLMGYRTPSLDSIGEQGLLVTDC